MDDSVQPGVLLRQLGQPEAAQEHLGKSYELGDAKQIKLRALGKAFGDSHGCNVCHGGIPGLSRKTGVWACLRHFA